MRLAVIILLILLSCCRPAVPAANNEQYIDRVIGNISPLLMTTKPQLHIPNQLIRVYLLRKDYTDDQICAFPLQEVGYNVGDVFCIKPVTDSLDWEWKQTCDHELEDWCLVRW